jgi:hypothetical protein
VNSGTVDQRLFPVDFLAGGTTVVELRFCLGLGSHCPINVSEVARYIAMSRFKESDEGWTVELRCIRSGTEILVSPDRFTKEVGHTGDGSACKPGLHVQTRLLLEEDALRQITR